ncbi:MAG: GTP 3',8-cyclase MoaA [Spirochaetes bacterium]|nr:GTP 3',8-cyclase MoaA [Spirochaetota bacterium]
MKSEKHDRGGLVDSSGRVIDYLRLSITDRCNLRCLYCMPAQGVDWIPHDDVMRFEETLKICRILVDMGIKAVRVTGGEPLVRRGTADFIRQLKALDGVERVAMTSNGILLGEYIDALAAAGLDALNISLDTLDGEKYKQLTGTDGVAGILPVIDRALQLGLVLKINCVLLGGFNEDDLVKVAAFAKNKNITVRFIELMPLGAAGGLKHLPAADAVSRIEETYGTLTASPVRLGYGPAVYYTLAGFAGHIGFISAVSHNFCNNCNRLRLTSSGSLKPCLSSDMGLDLKSLVRGGAHDDEIREAISGFIARKSPCHNFGDVNEKHEHKKKEMFRIGG